MSLWEGALPRPHACRCTEPPPLSAVRSHRPHHRPRPGRPGPACELHGREPHAASPGRGPPEGAPASPLLSGPPVAVLGWGSPQARDSGLPPADRVRHSPPTPPCACVKPPAHQRSGRDQGLARVRVTSFCGGYSDPLPVHTAPRPCERASEGSREPSSEPHGNRVAWGCRWLCTVSRAELGLGRKRRAHALNTSRPGVKGEPCCV